MSPAWLPRIWYDIFAENGLGSEREREEEGYVDMYIYICFYVHYVKYAKYVVPILYSYFFLFIWFDYQKDYVKISIMDLSLFPYSSVSFCFVCFEELVLDEFKFGFTILLKSDQGIYELISYA